MAACAPLATTKSSTDATGVSAVKDGGALTIATTAAPPSWNPLSAAGDTTTNRQQQWPLYPHAFVTNPDASVVVNKDLLTSAKIISQDPMVVEYQIKKNAVWSDGIPISADDFEYTQQVQSPTTCATCLAAFTQGYSLVTSITSSHASKTVKVAFSQPFSLWKSLFSYILPAHVAETYGTLAQSFNSGLAINVPKVSGGPYLVKSYDTGVSLTLVKNPKWYGSKAHLNTVTFRYIASADQQITALQNGEINVVYQNPTIDTVDQVGQMSGMTSLLGSTLTYYDLGFKTSGDLMGDKALRQAMTAVIDISDITKVTAGQYDKNVKPMESTAYIPGQVVDGKVAYVANAKSVGVGQGDVSAAKKILAKAGYTISGGKLLKPDGTAVRALTLLTYSVDTSRMQIAQLVQAELAKIGVTVTIDPADASRYGTATLKGQYDIVVTATALDLGYLSLAQWYQTGAARNSFGYSSTAADALMNQASTELDQSKQVTIMNKLDKTLMSDGVVVPLFALPQMAVYPSTYKNIFVNPSKYGTTMNIQQWGLAVSKKKN
jgi:peptide/nickel transport system substrate-binding protein